jgi:hypothetical protein
MSMDEFEKKLEESATAQRARGRGEKDDTKSKRC